MIKIEKIEIVGWEPALRGMRNAMESWDKSDSSFVHMSNKSGVYFKGISNIEYKETWTEFESINNYAGIRMGHDDLKLAQNLASKGGSHSKYRRMIVVYADVTAPLYWWKEYDTYKVGTVANSCSTMHKIHARELTLDDFSREHLLSPINCVFKACPKIQISDAYASPKSLLEHVVRLLNKCRERYLTAIKVDDILEENGDEVMPDAKTIWWQMIQLLPSSYNQKRTVMLNYEVLSHIYHDRKNHKLDEWREFCGWIESLPYAKELIIGEAC